MKRFTSACDTWGYLCVIVTLALILWACLAPLPLVVTIHAQTLPVTKTLAWDCPTCAADGVAGFTVTLDGTIIGSPTAMTQEVTFASAGSHTLAVRAVNMWDTSPPATLIVNVVIPQSPTTLRLQ